MNGKKRLIIEIVLFIVVLIGISVIYNYLVTKKQSTQQNNPENVEKEEAVEIMEIRNTQQFEQEVIKEKGIVFVDFYATWCMPCKAMSSMIEEIAKEHKEIKFVKIDIDKNEELAIQYNVMSIPTMMVIKNGEITKTFVGVTNKESIIKEFQ